MEVNKSVEILLVEDSDQDAELALRALQKNKISNKIIRLKDGEEALEFLFGTGEFEGRSKQKPMNEGLFSDRIYKRNRIFKARFYALAHSCWNT